jgi:DNA-binding response OmpR family regulator
LGKQQCRKILIINDSPTLNALLELTLKAEGFSVTAAVTGLSGLEEAGKMQYDLILLDYILPDINGLDVCRKLRKKELTRDTPIAFVSGTDAEELSEKSIDAGADAYIDSPFTGEAFIKRIRELSVCHRSESDGES